MDLLNKVALVVGGSGAIGGAIGRALWSKGCIVVAVGRREAALKALVEESSGLARLYVADFRRQSEARQCFDHVMSSCGQIDIVVYSTALRPDPDIPLAQYSIESWNDTISTYSTGFLICFQEAMRRLNRGAHILGISSAVTRFAGDSIPPAIFAGHYAAAKAALDQLCNWGRREAHHRGILLSRIAPGAVDTPAHRNAPLHLRPPAMIPVSSVVNHVLKAVEDDREIDELLVARPEGEIKLST